MTADNINSPLLKTALDENDPDHRGSETTSRLDQDAGGSRVTAVLSADLAGHITACNEAVLKMFGCTAAEVLGKTLAVLVAGEDDVEPAKLLETILGSVLKQGNFRCSVRCKNDESLIAADLSVTLLRDGRSVPAAMVAMLRASDGKPGMGSV
ncbi:MAG TPA: PAS domain S-box protein, partial [Candidatus Acidoferrum sp.]|nr:PAS domain S-box protein [Candidatus Acidoferrum sp.]